MAPRRSYKNAEGKRVKGVTTIIGRFKESGGLLHWANSVGLDGMTLEEARNTEATAGTIAHDFVEAHIKGIDPPDVSHLSEDILKRARASYASYLTWRKMFNVEVKYTEEQMVSEELQVGGRLDAVGLVNGELAILDWKAANAIYGDYLVQLAAYRILWHECYPDPEYALVGGAHLVRFAKENGDFSHHYFPADSMEREENAFRKMVDLHSDMAIIDKRAR